MINKKLVKKGAAAALALALTIPALAPSTVAAQENVKIDSVKFNGMKAPSTIDDMVRTYTNATVDVTYSNGKVKTFPLSYKNLFKSEDKVATTVKGEKIPAGTPIDVNGNPIKDPSSPDGKYFISDSPDSNSLLNPINGKNFMVTHYEYQTFDAAGKSAYGIVPASMSLTELSQDSKTGELKEKSVKKIDFSSVNGLWIPCNGSLSPWNTHLGSEEYEPDARLFLDPASTTSTQVKSFAKFYFGDEAKANPYFYGFIPEISVNANGDASVVKHYSTGRFSHELTKVMPDNKTLFFGDDGGNTGMFMYVADKEKDLSAGTLYAAKFVQTGTDNGGKGDLQWINLGHATDAEVKAIIDSKITFNDIFETSDAPKEGFKAIKTYSNGGKVEYLKLKPGKEKAAAFLEPRRYAAMLGATTEFNKMEGVTLNAKDSKVYIAMSYQEKAMVKDTTGKDPADDIQLPKISAGVTYQLDLKNGQKDNTGAAINSSYAAASMAGLVVGEDLPAADAFGNTANPDKVANPDNLSYSEAMRTLFIGEDSGMHTNNYVWAYNVDTKKLDRILSIPAGAEATGLFAEDNLNGFSYIMSNFQHPGDELDTKKVTAVDQAKLKAAVDQKIGIDKTGGIGYIAGLPSFTNMPDFTAPNAPSIGKVADSTTTITGKAEAKSVVDLYINNNYSESATTDSNGNYKFSGVNVKAGSTIKVTATDEAGNESDAKEVTVFDQTAPVVSSVNKVTVKSKSVTGKAEKGATVQVYNGKKLVGKAVANAKGNFSVKIKAQLDGTSLKVIVKDKAGNQSKATIVKVTTK